MAPVRPSLVHTRNAMIYLMNGSPNSTSIRAAAAAPASYYYLWEVGTS